MAIDFETTGDFVAGGIRPRLVQLFAGGDEVAVADLELIGFAPIACLADVGCVAYGAGFEARVFMGQKLEPRLNDAALAAGLRLDRDAFQRDLATTWRRIKGKPTPTNKKAMQRSDFSGELTPEQIAYAASDAIMAFQVWEACRTEARSRPYAVARDAIPAVASMEMAGLGYDRAAHVAIMGEWNRLAENEARRFNELTGLWPKEQKKFRERLQSSVAPDLLETWPRADKGGLSLSGKTLEHKPQARLPEVAQYLRAKALGTLITTFGPKMAARVSPITRRLHFGFTLCGARTGRMTSSPNGQNLPAGPYRRIFRAPPGRRMVSLDYSAIELRAAALLAGEKSLLDVFKHPPRLPNGERNPKGDPHEALSATLQLDPVRNAGLRLAKALNFRLLFGTGVEGFAENANISIEEAGELVDRWRRVRSSMVQWQNGTKAAAKRQKYATTPLGRRVNCYDVDPDTKNLRFKPNRALNVPIQGGCAEALMVALPLAYDGLRGSGLSAGLIAAVHDEIVFECAEADVEPATAIVHQAMMTGLEKVFGARPRFQDIALYAVGAPKVGQTWDGDAFDLASLSEKETMVLLKGLADVDEGEEDDEPANSLERADALRGAQGCRLLRRRKVPHDLPQHPPPPARPRDSAEKCSRPPACRPGSRCRSPPSSTSGLSPWPNGWASPPPPSCAGPSPPTSPSSRRSIPNPMEDAMTSSTNSKKSNGLQGDLLSGEWQSGAPRRGTGQHIRLKPLGDDQRVAVPGMADFSGGGPAGTYCRDCNHFADEIAVQTGINTIEKTRFGCVIWAQKWHMPPLHRGATFGCAAAASTSRKRQTHRPDASSSTGPA